MTISFHFQPYHPWQDADERAESAGYRLEHIAGPDLLKVYGSNGGPFGVFKNGELLARFTNPIARDKYLHTLLSTGKDNTP